MNIPMTNWIWIPDWSDSCNTENIFVCFRKEFQISSIPPKCVVNVSADSRYKLYVNSVLVETGPCKGDSSVWYYETVEIQQYLKVGENCICAEVLHYSTDTKKGNFSVFRTETPGFYLKETDGTLGISADATWKCRIREKKELLKEDKYFAPLYFFEKSQGLLWEKGWKNAGYTEDGWKEVKRYHILEISRTEAPGNLFSRPIPCLYKKRQKFELVPKEYTKDTDYVQWSQMLCGQGNVLIGAHSHVKIDIGAGELTTGFFSVRMKKGKKCCLKILYSEGYELVSDSENGEKKHRKECRSDWKNGELFGFTDEYRAAGYDTEQVEEYQPFWFRTFRYIQLDITTKDEPLLICGIDYLETGYPLDVKTQVDCADEKMNQIWEISLRSLKRCMHETYEDCPFYEQMQYLMDSRSQILYTYSVSMDDRMARRCMNDFKRSIHYDGTLNASYPRNTYSVIPGFSIYYILMLYDHMMYFGDKKFLREHVGTIDNVLEYFNRNLDSRGMVGKLGGRNIYDKYWSFIDWTKEWDATTGMPPAGMKGPVTMESFLYILGLQRAADIMEYMEKQSMVAEYRNRAVSVQMALRKYCCNEQGWYQDGPGIEEYSQHCQVFAILTDSLDVKTGKNILLETIEHTEKYAQCSVAMKYYLFRAMEKTGLYGLTKKCWKIWENMLEEDLTTCVEDDINKRSDCHAWGALALYEIPEVILGIRPGAPGYSKIEIHPQLGFLDSVSGKVITGQGMLYMNCKKDKEGISYWVKNEKGKLIAGDKYEDD